MEIHLYQNDLPSGLDLGKLVAIDTEAMGLLPHRDRLCMAQLSAGDGHCHLVHFTRDSDFKAPNLKKLLQDPTVTKLFHFARFDVGVLYHYLNVLAFPLYCTKIASKLTRTYTDRHGLKDLCKELLGIEISKQEQTSDWGAETLTKEQQRYAATDVLHLHALKEKLHTMLIREGRQEIAEACFKFIPYRAQLDLLCGSADDIFHH